MMRYVNVDVDDELIKIYKSFYFHRYPCICCLVLFISLMKSLSLLMQANSHYFAIIEQVYTSKRSSFTYVHLCGYINELCVKNLLNNYD